MYISTDYCIVFCESIRRVSCELIYASYSPDCQEEEAVVGPDQPFARTQPANFAVKTSSWRLCSSTNSYSAGSGEKAWPIFCACLKQNTGLLTLVMKRSSSAPMIPELLDPKPSHLHASLQSRRGLSASNMSLPGDYGKLEFSPRKQPLASPLSLSRINSPTSRHRVEQLRMEESIDERRREESHEREVTERIQLNHSCEELKLDSELEHSESMEVWPALFSSSPQSFVSPSSPVNLLSRVARSRSLTPTSPSQARTFSYRRSLSPVCLRPSNLCWTGKRKREQEQEDMDVSPVSVPAKRLAFSFVPSVNSSPNISPMMGNSPLQHYHWNAVKSKTSSSSSGHSESTPIPSPSCSGTTSLGNPFAVNYDSGNSEHLSSSAGSCSSSVTSSLINSTRPDACASSSNNSKPFLCDLSRTSNLNSNHSYIHPTEDQRSSFDSFTSDVVPTPLSPKGLQFSHQPSTSTTLPSPIPRVAQSTITTASYAVPIPRSTGTAATTHTQKQALLRHDRLNSPFHADTTPNINVNAVHAAAGHRSRAVTLSSLRGRRHGSHPGRAGGCGVSSPKVKAARLKLNRRHSLKKSSKLSVVSASMMGPGAAGDDHRDAVHLHKTSPSSLMTRHRHDSETSSDSKAESQDSLMESEASSVDEETEYYDQRKPVLNHTVL